MSIPPQSVPPNLSEALNRIWTRILPEIENRVTIVESAARALAADSLSESQRMVAHEAAHKLAGILGTFGLPKGTDLARKAELLLAEKISASSAPVLSAWMTEIQSMVDSRK